LVQLAKIYAQFEELGVSLWAISPQSVEKNRVLIERRELPFPILSDADQKVIRQWGVFNDEDPKGRAIPYPATYLIDQKGWITWVHIGQSTRDRPSSDEILLQIKQINNRTTEQD
jgi:peroxiredoxin Q/BCP